MFVTTSSGIKNLIGNKKTAVALGSFDGVHMGHKALIEKVCEFKDCVSVVHNFVKMPESLISKSSAILTSNEAKIKIFEGLNLDGVVFDEFTQEYMHLSPSDFIMCYLKQKLNCGVVVCGYDYHFGYNRMGNAEFLKQTASSYGIKVAVVDMVSHNGVPVKSTKIRELIQNGEIGLANQMLTRSYFIEGKVTDGKKIGRLMGFNTANINLPENAVIPQNGVYVCNAEVLGKKFRGVLNIGTRPTVNGTQRNIEVHILDFCENIYSQNIKVEFLHKIRNEMRFENIQKLSLQIQKDCDFAKKF